ncbi:type VI secretion system immunity protein Tsi4, partial [Pseudomonas aeruginosa]
MTTSSGSRIGGLLHASLFSLLGLGLLLAGGFKTVERYHFLRTAQEAQGTVSALNAGGSHPQIDFTSVSGERISYPQGGFIFGYQVGEPVRVLYEAGRPAASAIV